MRGGSLAVAISGIVLVLAVLVGGGFDVAPLGGAAENAASTREGEIGSAQSQYEERVTICHYSSSSDRGKTMTLPRQAAEAHLRNHPDDTAGPCPDNDDPKCVRSSAISFKINRGAKTRVTRVDAFVNGKRKLRARGKDVRRVTLAKLKRGGKLSIRIVSYHTSGARVVSTRSWNGCKRGKPSVRRVGR